MRYILIPLLILFLSSCGMKEPKVSQSATILIKTPTMKFYDKGFITTFDDYTQVQIYSAGQTVLDLQLYDDRVCRSTFECQSAKQFNKEFLHSSYEDSFLKTLFNSSEKNVVHRDKNNRILIKIKRD